MRDLVRRRHVLQIPIASPQNHHSLLGTGQPMHRVLTSTDPICYSRKLKRAYHRSAPGVCKSQAEINPFPTTSPIM